jgi:hypothetical protein
MLREGGRGASAATLQFRMLTLKLAMGPGSAVVKEIVLRGFVARAWLHRHLQQVDEMKCTRRGGDDSACGSRGMV